MTYRELLAYLSERPQLLDQTIMVRVDDAFVPAVGTGILKSLGDNGHHSIFLDTTVRKSTDATLEE